MNDSWDCLCAGIIVADQVCEPIAALPKSGELVLTPRLTFTIGGCAANVGVDMARLGLRVGISGCVGDDLFGRALQEMLVTHGVDCTQIRELPGTPTSGTFVVNVQGEDRRFIHCIGANGLYDPTQITDDILRRHRILYVGGYCLLDSMSPERVAQLFQRARALGVTTVLDVVLGNRDISWDWLAPVLPYTDAFLPNDDEAQRITGLTDPWEQAARCRAAGCGTVVITCGGAGSFYDGPDGRLHADVYQVPVVDPTGTGDAFVAGFLYGLLREAPPMRCLQYGAALGASCVQAMGATTGVFTATELEDFVAQRPLRIEALPASPVTACL